MWLNGGGRAYWTSLRGPGFIQQQPELAGVADLDPSHANAQVALGVAALRDQDTATARAPLELQRIEAE